MALIKCKDCGKEVSQDAIACPNCGNDIQKQIKREKEKKQREKEKKEQKEALDRAKQVKIWQEKGELCPHCYAHCPGDICPTCGKPKKTPMWANIAAGCVVVGVILFIIIFFVQACSDAANSGPTEEEARKWQNCSNRSNTYQKCSWNHWEDRCVCKLR